MLTKNYIFLSILNVVYYKYLILPAFSWFYFKALIFFIKFMNMAGLVSIGYRAMHQFEAFAPEKLELSPVSNRSS